MTHRELERMARERYGPQALVIIDRTRPDKARREEIRARRKAARERRAQIEGEIKDLGDVLGRLAVAGRFALDVDGDEPSWTKLRQAVEAAERLDELRRENAGLRDALNDYEDIRCRYEVLVQFGVGREIKCQADTAEELAEMIRELGGVEQRVTDSAQ